MLRRVAKWVAIVFVVGEWVALPAGGAVLASCAPHPTVAVPGLSEVRFAARDGIRLVGSYAPGRNGRGVVVAHGSHGDRRDTLAQVRLLRAAGFAVLTFDARGHGESGGRTNALGWAGVDDVAGAVAFLRTHGARSVAALGLSMGGEEILRAAATGVPLAAIVADGAGASTLGDRRLVEHGPLAPVAISSEWVMFRLTALLTRVSEPAPLVDLAPRIRVPVLFVASGAKHELALDRAYAARMQHATVWSAPDAGHTKVLERHPREYARRILAVLRQ